MTAAVAAEQAIATFALHAAWQAPLLTGAAWCAVRVGRPAARVAYAVWVGTLLLCVLLPVASSVAARRAALAAERAAQVSAAYEGGAPVDLPPMARQPAWLRLFQQHVNVRDGVEPFAVTVPDRAARVIAQAWIVTAAFFLVQLCAGWVRVRRLVRRASKTSPPAAIAEALRRQSDSLGVRRPETWLHDEVAGPVLAGVLRPVLLLPEGSAAAMSPPEVEAVLAHELAHLRRNDPVMHAACSLLLLPVCFHPAAWWAARAVRGTREMACDAEAAQRLGSTAQYAHALLRVAERAGGRGAAAGAFFSNGLLGAGLQLFTHRGAMEERMQMLMNNGDSKAGNRVARVAAGVVLAAAGLAAATMLQVQPTLAAERGLAQAATASSPQAAPVQDSGPALLGGEHAREQLRRAHRELKEAEARATDREERRKIEGAQQVVSAAEQALAAADASSSPQVELDLHALDHLDVQLKNLKMPDMAELQLQLDKQHEAMEKLRARMNSPEWKAQMDAQNRAMDAVRKQMDSPEWKTQMDAARRAADQARERMNSPEFRAQMEAASKIDRAKMNEIMAEARVQQQKAMEQLRSGELQRHLDAARLMARVDSPTPLPQPFPAATPQNPDKPLQVAPGVMQGNKLSGDNPVYPAEAKEKHITGTVVLHAIIDKTGKVESVQVVSSPDDSLSKSAVAAVQTWVYKPYLLNGNPMAVDTTMNINFSLAQ